eukprot:7325353-Prymnesium_polylepis.1
MPVCDDHALRWGWTATLCMVEEGSTCDACGFAGCRHLLVGAPSGDRVRGQLCRGPPALFTGCELTVDGEPSGRDGPESGFYILGPDACRL